MDKISGIVKSSPRVTSVDMKESSPVRPGTPTFGRPNGVSSLGVEAAHNAAAAAVANPTTAEKGNLMFQNQMDWRTKDSKQAAIVGELGDKFFIKNRIEADAGDEMAELKTPLSATSVRALSNGVSSTPAGFKTDEVGALRASTGRGFSMDDEFENGPVLAQPQGLYPKGSFIDRTA